MEIEIDIKEAVRYMGYRDEPPQNQMDLIQHCADELKKCIQPAFVYRVFELDFTEEGVKLQGSSLIFKGMDIRQHLEGCQKCILFCATAGIKTDELIRQKESEDINTGFITDCLASAAAEAVCNALEKELAAKLPDMYFTWRFSPGYGDFPLEIQPKIIDVLNAAKRTGVTCTEGLMLVPTKSVTAIIGVSDTPIAKKRQNCTACNMHDRCTIRKNGAHCHG